MNRILSIIIFLVAFNTANAQNQFSIGNIYIGPQGKDQKDKLSLMLNLTNHSENINNWKFGFYMPRSFRPTSTSNTKLTMQICEIKKPKNCSQLIYTKPKFSQPDLSSVFTTILSPDSNYPLKKNTTYKISLLHNSSKAPLNYSALPQSFFIIADNEVINISTKPQQYKVTNYDANKTQTEIQDHISNNWNNSNNTLPELNLIPTPQLIEWSHDAGKFDINSNLSIHNMNAPISSQMLDFLSSNLSSNPNSSLVVDVKPSTSGIILTKLKTANFPLEAYTLTIDHDTVTIAAYNDAGFFYALQTLKQLMYQNSSLPLLTITDYPRFKYRGILLDVARHYYTLDEIKNFIDIMSTLKLNTLHLHLSDDEGFRLQIPDYPQLTNIGANRGIGKPIGAMDMMQKNLSKSANSYSANLIEYKGSYSPSDINKLINYANLRQITIIPEIDIPGHSRALMKSLPDIFYESGDTSEYSGHGDNSIPVCAYNDNSDFGKNFTTTLRNILIYTSNVFKNQTTIYNINNELSIGGDEVASKTWDKSPLCQNEPWKEKSSLEKEHYFLDQLNNYGPIKQIPLSGWHEFILTHDNKLDANRIKPSETGHVWVWGVSKNSIEKAKIIADNGYPTVISYSDSVYFDMTYTPQFNEPGFYWATHYGDTYAALNIGNLVNKTLTQTSSPQNILGIEAGIWGDVIPDYQQFQYMSTPKITGLAEASWSNSNITTESGLPNWRSLSTRLGCGKSGYLAYINKQFNTTYRGYPNGISLEAPQACQ